MPRKRKPSELDALRDPRPPAEEPDRARAEAYERWNAKVQAALEVRRAWERDYDVEKGERYFLGDHDEARVRMNHTGATIKTARPNLALQAPTFFVRPKPGHKQFEAERTAAIGEGLLASIAQQDDHLEIAMGLATTQAYFRLGVLKIVYDPRLEPNPQKGEVIYERTEAGETATDATGDPIPMKDPMTGAVLREPDEVLTDEVYRWAWVDAANLILPDEGPDPLKWSWIGEEVVVPLDHAKEDPRFPATLRAKLEANETSKRSPEKGSGRRALPSTGTEERYLRYYETYDLRAKRQRIWAPGQAFQQFLVDEPVPRWIDNDPYALLRLGEDIIGPEPCPWPVPVVRDWIPVQDEYNTRRRQITEGAKRSARKGVFTEGAFADTDEAVKLLQNPEDMVFAKVADIEGVKILEVPDINQSIYKDIPMLFNDWRIITGQTGARMGDPESDTATEATFVERASNLRDSEMQRRVFRWLSQAGKKMFQCVKSTLTISTWVQLRDLTDDEFKQYVVRRLGIAPEEYAQVAALYPGLREAAKERFGRAKWQAVTREQLQFEADVMIAPGSSRPRNLDTERREWMEFLRILGQFPQLALSPELLKETASKFASSFSDRILDELGALARQMIQVNANQAGRNQGGDNGAGTGGRNDAGMMASMMNGRGM